MTKGSYKEAKNKRILQEEILNQVKQRTILGLGGPDVDDYINILENKGFKKIFIYENNFSVFNSQISKFRHTLIYDNILNHLGKSAFYDLDFCCTIKSIPKESLEKISRLESYSLTLSLRGVSLIETLKMFTKYCGEQLFRTYRDSSPMVTFFKI